MNRIKIWKTIIILLLFILQSSALQAQDTNETGSLTVKVEGTELEHLQSVADIMEVLPGLVCTEEGYFLIGRGKPDIYLDNRKLKELLELDQISADRVKEIEVLRHPGVEFDKGVESVIVIRLKKSEAEGFTLSNVLRFDQTHALSINEQLTLGWRRKRFTLGGFAGWNEDRSYWLRNIFINQYEDHKLINEVRQSSHPDVTAKSFSARFSLRYDFDHSNKLSFRYSYLNRPTYDTWQEELSSKSCYPDTRHDFALEYEGKIGKWNVTIANNSFIDQPDFSVWRPTYNTFYLRKEFDSRTYLKASRKLWQGSVTVGAEHELDYMDLKMYEDNPSYNPQQQLYFSTHAEHPDNTLAAFFSAMQTFGRWTIEAGLRYEHNSHAYRPLSDDGLMLYLDDIQAKGEVGSLKTDALVSELMKNREVRFSNDRLFPSLKVSTKIGKSELSLKHTENSIRPYLGLTRLRYSELEILNMKMLWTEYTNASTLGWKYEWLNLTATYMHYKNPVCTTTSSLNQYNANDYNAMDYAIMLSPKVGIWSPMLNVNLHKQWFTMPLANGKDVLKEPLLMMVFKNTLQFPRNWTVRLNAQWHSKGANRNDRFYTTDFNMDGSVQKNFPHLGLSFVLNAQNIFRSSYLDISRYVQEYYGVSEGLRDRLPRKLSLTVKYDLK